MSSGRRLIVLSVFLILAGIGSYFLSDPKTYDASTDYELSRAKDGKWERTVISGADLNAENPRNKAQNQILSIAFVGAGVALLGFQLMRMRRER
jgi:hypothetical protein